MSEIYVIRNESLCTPIYARQLVENAVESGASKIHLGSLEYTTWAAAEELSALAAEYDIEYIGVRNGAKRTLESVRSDVISAQ